MPRKWIRAVLLLAGAALTLVLTAAVAPAKTPGGKLSKEEAACIAQGERERGQDRHAALRDAARAGQDRRRRSRRRSARTIGYRDDALGYIRADVPTDKVKEAFALPGVEAADIDQVIPLPDPRPEAGRVDAATRPPARPRRE